MKSAIPDEPPIRSSGSSQLNLRSRAWPIALAVSTTAFAAAGGITFLYSRQNAQPGERSPPVRVVRTAHAARETLPIVAEYRGELVSEAAELAAQASGRILEVTKDLGDEVTRGELLALVDVAETKRLLAEALAQKRAAQASQARAKTQHEQAKLEFERGKALLRERVLSAQELANLEAQVSITESEIHTAEANLAASAARAGLYQTQVTEARLAAPFDGLVAERYLDPGSSVTPGTPILRLVKASALRVRFRVSEAHLRQLRPGSPLTLRTLTTEDDDISGEVSRIGAEVSRTDRSVAVEGIIKDDSSALKPGMYAVVTLELGLLENATTIPARSLITRLDTLGKHEAGVMTVDGDRAEYVTVDVLGTYENRSAVTNLAPGTKIITFGQDLVSDGSKIREVDEDVEAKGK